MEGGMVAKEGGRSSVSQREVDLSSFAPRERILAAALKLFVERGYFNTNVPDLSKESKCSIGSIYHNFKNKEEVASELYGESIKAFRRALEHRVSKEQDPELFVKALVRSFMEFSEINHQLSRYIWLCRHNEFMSGIIRHPTVVGLDPLGRAITRVIKGGVRSGKIRKVKANVVWSILFGIPLAYVRDWLDGYNAAPPREVAPDIADACWRALKS